MLNESKSKSKYNKVQPHLLYIGDVRKQVFTKT
jgi:hypothetical protein